MGTQFRNWMCPTRGLSTPCTLRGALPQHRPAPRETDHGVKAVTFTSSGPRPRYRLPPRVVLVVVFVVVLERCSGAEPLAQLLRTRDKAGGHRIALLRQHD